MSLSKQAKEFWSLATVLNTPKYHAGHLCSARDAMLDLLDSPYPQIKRRALIVLEGLPFPYAVGVMR